MRTATYIFFFLILSFSSFSQEKKNHKDVFDPPLDIPLYLSGTFGELRSDHFHSGIDIKTQGVEGKAVLSIGEGYVSRIKVGTNGFGKALYITHPNGYTSVYAHLKKFAGEIQNYVVSRQYERETYEVNLFPDKNSLLVKKGELVALSGNSGGSNGPHLHFEIRKTKSEKPLNPLFFEFPVKDYVRPKIKGVKIYPYNHLSQVNESAGPLEFKVEGWGEKHRLVTKKTIRLSGDVYFGIATYDQSNDMPNKNGVYSVELFVDTNLIYAHRLEEFAFAESRYINSLIDYAAYKEKKIRYQKSLIEPNNRLSIYKQVENDGVVSFNDSLTHNIRYVIKDVNGNVSSLFFHVQAIPVDSTLGNPMDTNGVLFSWDRDNSFSSAGFELKTTSGSFYDSFMFNFDTCAGNDSLLSKIYRIHNKYTPVHKWINISVPITDLPEEYFQKALLVNIDEDGEMYPAGGKYNNGRIDAKIREFGNYAVTADTVQPGIKPLNIHNKKKITGYKTIKIKIKDELSGIDEYRGTLNGNWILMEYDPKRDLLTYFVDDRMQSGENTFHLSVKDERGNLSEYKAVLFY